MGARKTLITCFLVLISHQQFVQGEECENFPEFLQNKADDESDIWYRNMDGSPDRAFRFLNETVQEANMTWGLTDDFIEDDSCLQTVNASINLFLMNTTSGRDCVRYDQHGPNIVRVLKVPEDKKAGCQDQTLDPIPQLLISSRDRTNGGRTYNRCPLEGGFTFTSEKANKTKKSETCKHPLPGRLEVNCLPEDGMTFIFPDETCIPVKQGWSKEQSLMCLSMWSEGVYDFTVLGKEYFKPEWCMRTDHTKPNEVVIFNGVDCPTDEKPDMDFSIFNLTQLESSECQDDWDKCEERMCSNSLYAGFCRKTCKECIDDKAKCEFDESIVTPGDWSSMVEGKVMDIPGLEITISKDTLVFGHYTNYTCTHKIDAATYLLQPTVSKGCRPRVSCGNFLRLTPPVLRHKFSQSMFYYKTPEEVCEEKQFQDDPEPLGDKYRSSLFKNLISMDAKLQSQTSECIIRGNYTITEAKRTIKAEEPVSCTGNLGALDGCNTTHDVIVSLTCQGKDKPESHSIECIGEVPSGNIDTRMMLGLSGAEGKKEATCWLVHSTSGVDKIHVLSSGQCNEGTPIEVALSKIVSELDVEKLERTDDCNLIITTENPIPQKIPSASSVTTPTSESSTGAPSPQPKHSTTDESTTTIPISPTPNVMNNWQVMVLVIGAVLLLPVLVAFLVCHHICKKRKKRNYESLDNKSQCLECNLECVLVSLCFFLGGMPASILRVYGRAD